MTDWVDFKAVKAAVSMETVLTRYGLELRPSGKSLRGHCPLPMHGKRSKPPGSFSVSTTKNAWACQSEVCCQARDGRKGGNVLDFVAFMEGCSIREAAIKLRDWYGLKGEGEPSAPAASPSQLAPEETKGESASVPDTESNPPLAFELKGIDSSHEYLTNRGITAETASAFGVGYYPGKGMMHGRIVFPIHNSEGQLVAYAGRFAQGGVIPQGESKYTFPPRFSKSLELYNLHRVPADAKVVTVVEGFFCALWLAQSGFPAVVALMGSSMSKTQSQSLFERFRGIQIFLDGDEAGIEGSRKAVLELAGHSWVRVITCPGGSQPTDLSTDELKALLG